MPTKIERDDKGDAVSNVHQFLIEAGYSVDAIELSRHFFGPSTEDAVRAFQASHVGPAGLPLGEDGIVGDQTLWAFKNPSLRGAPRFTVAGWRCDPLSARVEVRQTLTIAVAEIGAAETPGKPNRGPRVDVYTAPRIGIPWCAAFVSWCWAQGTDGNAPFGRIDSAWGLYEWAARQNKVIMATHPDVTQVYALLTDVQPGDIFLVLRGRRKDADRRGHAGFVAATDVGKFYTVAGNESDAVRGGVRTLEGVSAIIRPA